VALDHHNQDLNLWVKAVEDLGELTHMHPFTVPCVKVAVGLRGPFAPVPGYVDEQSITVLQLCRQTAKPFEHGGAGSGSVRLEPIVAEGQVDAAGLAEEASQCHPEIRIPSRVGDTYVRQRSRTRGEEQVE